MSKHSLERFYEPNLRLTQAHGLIGYNAGYAESRDGGSFDEHQRDLVWKLLGDAPIGPDSVVLDVGCGIGGPSTWIHERFHPKRVIGMDYCFSSVRAAHQRLNGATDRPRFLRGDAHRLPLPDASVDVIFNLESALHYSDKHQFLSECFRILKPGAMLCLGDVTTEHRKFFKFAQMLDIAGTQFSTQATLWRTRDYLEAFEATGFTLMRHDMVSQQAANALKNGLADVGRVGWRGAKGYRGRFCYLWMMEVLFRREWLIYDLFALRKPA
ncbi:MAG TPA: class I SAM-dependent methyltransferase [Phycisphaerae bacterium]|nr:class I SAM-dependent methyltransferase [Phycisphaerae bacterium]HRW52954.1 class I SAM-dependent methyltransferase [Phycisphaerae bacterium]